MSLPSWEGVTATISKDYQLELLTPLLMHGWQEKTVNKDGKENNQPVYAETRVPSFKGVLHYWWRALQTEVSPTALLTEEQSMFGGTGATKEEGIRSPLMLQIRQPLREGKKKVSALPHKGNVPVIAISGKRDFILTVRLYKKDAHRLESYHKWLCFMLLLSGFGQRARRGAGALQYDAFQWSTVQQFQDELRTILQQCQRSEQFAFDGAGSAVLRRVAGKAKHPILCGVWVGRSYPGADEARTAISKAGHEANPGSRTVQWLGSAKSKRVASPLHATVRRIGEGYRPIISEVIANAEPQYENRDYLAAREQFLLFLGVK